MGDIEELLYCNVCVATVSETVVLLCVEGPVCQGS